LYIDGANNGSMTVSGGLANKTVTMFTPGSFTFLANCTDAASNINDTSSTTITVSDLSNPLTFDPIPTAGSGFNVGNDIEVGINVTDNGPIDVVFANISLPNGSNEIVTLTNVTAPKYNGTFSIPGLTGFYSITFVANDSSNNINNSATTNFTVSDVSIPDVFDLKPESSQIYNLSQTIEIAANVTDDVAVDTVLANITLPDSSTQVISLSLATGAKYNGSFNISQSGAYTARIIANDTSDGLNDTETTTFAGAIFVYFNWLDPADKIN